MVENNCHNDWFCVKESENWRGSNRNSSVLVCAIPSPVHVPSSRRVWPVKPILASVEKELKFREKLQTMNPAVTSFLRGKSSVVEAAITLILSLVSRNKSTHNTNQANLFDYIV